MASSNDPRQLIAWTLAMTVITVVVAWALFRARGVLLLIYVSALFTIGFSPLVRAIERQKILPIGTRRLPRWLAILVIYVAILGSFALLIALLTPPLARQARDFAAALPDMLSRTESFLIARGVLDHEVTLRDALGGLQGGTGAVGTVFSAVWGFVGGVFGLLTVLILTFYFLVEWDQLGHTILRLFPWQRRARVAELARQITTKVSAWLVGQLILALTIGTTATIGLWLLGVPYFYVLAVIAAIGELIPVVGPILSAVPAVLVALSVSPGLALAVAIFFVLQQQFENHILVPKVMSSQVGVSAATVIVALLIGGSLLGIVGAILAVPTAAILQVLVNELTAQDVPPASQT
jgi:predicted PurR-regulated permease PerM